MKKDRIEIAGLVYEAKPLIQERYGFTDMDLHRAVKSGAFPKPVRLNGHRAYWNVSEIEQRILAAREA